PPPRTPPGRPSVHRPAPATPRRSRTPRAPVDPRLAGPPARRPPTAERIAPPAGRARVCPRVRARPAVNSRPSLPTTARPGTAVKPVDSAIAIRSPDSPPRRHEDIPSDTASDAVRGSLSTIRPGCGGLRALGGGTFI